MWVIQLLASIASNDTSRIGEHRLTELKDWRSPDRKQQGLWTLAMDGPLLATQMRPRGCETQP
jgi:hypothetical protein